MNNLDDTQPRRPVRPTEELAPPPRILFWGLIIIFVFVILGGIAGIFIFREVFDSGQQERVIGILPFMEAFQEKIPTPQGGAIATPASADSDADPLSLLDIQVNRPEGEETAEPEATVEPEPTMTATSVAVVPTIPPTSTPVIPTATTAPTTAPTQDTVVPVSQVTTNTASTTVSSLPASARMFGFRWEKQTWNNCGPANITMGLSYFGWERDLKVAENYVKPNREDKNVSPHELVDFVNEKTGVQALMRVGGDLRLLKALIANEFPVIIETSAMFEGYDWIGHYRTIVAYDDVLDVFYIYDSFLGIGDNAEGVALRYDELDYEWKAFNRVFIVLYTPDREARLRQILGDRQNEEGAAQIAFEVAQEEIRSNPEDGFAWFNLGTSLNILGQYTEAARAFDQARRVQIPWRMLWYQFGPFEAYYETGRYNEILSLAQSNLNNAEELEETYYWQGKALAALGETAQAATAFRTALRYNPNYTEAREALDALNL